MIPSEACVKSVHFCAVSNLFAGYEILISRELEEYRAGIQSEGRSNIFLAHLISSLISQVS